MITFETAYGWLNRFADRKSYLRPPVVQLVQQMRAAIESRDFERVNDLINDLLSLSLSGGNDLEIAESQLACASAYYRMGHFHESLDHISPAVVNYQSNRHNVAIAKWLAGCVLWRMPGKHVEAANAWQQSLELFESLANNYRVLEDGSKWYRECCTKMRTAIQETVARDGLPSASGMNLFIAFDQYPSGNQKPMVVEQYCIGGAMYFPVSINGEREIDVKKNHELFAVRAMDDSMDQGGIEEGDYILFRKNDSPENGNIVLVLFQGEENGMIRQFVSSSRGLELRPCSLNSSFQARTFNRLNKGFLVRGVAIAILKPY